MELGSSVSEWYRVAVSGEGSPANNAGIKVGDFVVQVGEISTPSVEALYDSLVGREEGESLDIKVANGSGTLSTLSVTVRLR